MTRFPAQLSAALFDTAILVAPFVARGDEPDALSVEWQGQKPCEKVFEDAQIRIARCTFPPGSKHVRHSHPAYISYVLSGGKAEVQDEKSTRQVEARTGSYVDIPPVSWHEVMNVGDTDRREEVSAGVQCQSDHQQVVAHADRPVKFRSTCSSASASSASPTFAAGEAILAGQYVSAGKALIEA